MQRPSSEAAEDRNQDWLGGLWAFAGQRPSSEAAEDRNYGRTVERRACPHGSGRLPRRPRIATPDCCGLGQRVIGAAAVFRGGRGSQPWLWNNIVVPAFRCSGRLPRRPRIATCCLTVRAVNAAQRPSSEAAEDRNIVPSVTRGGACPGAAAVFRGGRGSQPPRGSMESARHERDGSGRLPRRPRIATGTAGSTLSGRTQRSGRLPRRPRIATSTTA